MRPAKDNSSSSQSSDTGSHNVVATTTGDLQELRGMGISLNNMIGSGLRNKSAQPNHAITLDEERNKFQQEYLKATDLVDRSTHYRDIIDRIIRDTGRVPDGRQINFEPKVMHRTPKFMEEWRQKISICERALVACIQKHLQDITDTNKSRAYNIIIWHYAVNKIS